MQVVADFVLRFEFSMEEIKENVDCCFVNDFSQFEELHLSFEILHADDIFTIVKVILNNDSVTIIFVFDLWSNLG